MPPKFPSHLSKEAKEFLFLCLNRDPRKRSTAKELLEHRFLKSIYYYFKHIFNLILII